ncbi:MAG TPA: hypothetical protein VM345_16535 [Acidimicrobiales bacterium]|nr:hypothetical protein [Acidimicrobiales bacterium]
MTSKCAAFLDGVRAAFRAASGDLTVDLVFIDYSDVTATVVSATSPQQIRVDTA